MYMYVYTCTYAFHSPSPCLPASLSLFISPPPPYISATVIHRLTIVMAHFILLWNVHCLYNAHVLYIQCTCIIHLYRHILYCTTYHITSGDVGELIWNVMRTQIVHTHTHSLSLSHTHTHKHTHTAHREFGLSCELIELFFPKVHTNTTRTP